MSIATRQVEYSRQPFSHIDERVRALQTEVWERRFELWNGNPPMHRIGVLEPAVALEMLGYNVELVNTLGQFRVNGVRSEAAGEIDGDQKVVRISRRFLVPEQRFTLAHELGHAVCHPDIGRMHRDLPLEHAGVVRNPREVEANHFGSVFLMPEMHVRAHFLKRFLAERLHLADEAVAYALCGTSADTIRMHYKGLRSFSRFVAGTGHFNGKQFQSLASLFGVSVTAMAIRLEELALIDY